MNIGIDISQIVYEGTGVSRFTQGLTKAICTYGNKHRWVFFFSSFRRNLQPEIKKLILKKGYMLIERKIPPRFLAGLLIKVGFKVESIDSTLDWFITSDWAEIPSDGIKKATIVHDLTYIRYPEVIEKNVRNTQIDRLRRVKKTSSVIFADSYSTKKDLVQFLEIEEKKIVVNYPGVTVIKPSKEDIVNTLSKYKINKPYILSVGKTEPRKNLSRLIDAFRLLNKPGVELVIVGPQGWDNSLTRTLENSTGEIKLLGHVNDTELYSLYSSALFFIYPSLWEGFGYPMIESMQFGVPVACSNTSSLSELGDKYALTFDPLKTDEISSAMHKFIGNEPLRSQLSKKEQTFAKTFTWKKYYNILVDTLENRS